MSVWNTYFAGNFWIFGMPYQLFFGITTYTWFWYFAIIQLYQVYELDKPFVSVAANYRDWMMGPFRRIITGSMIFMLSLLCTMIPGMNLLSGFFGYWAVMDMYDYDYDYMDLGKKIDDDKWGDD